MGTEKCARVTTKVYAILNWIIGGIYLLAGLYFLFFSKGLTTAIMESGASIPSLALVAIGIILLVAGLFDIIVAIGVWKLNNWARIVSIVILILGLISTLFGIISGSTTSWMLVYSIVALVYFAFFLYNFAFNKMVRKIFTNVFKKRGLK